MEKRVTQEYSFDEICPYVREVGLQRRDAWRTLSRKIYDHELFYCFVGEACISIGGTNYHIQKGDLVIVPPNTSHVLWFEEGVAGELYWCHFDYFFFADREWHYGFYNNPDTYLTLFQNELRYKEHLREEPVFAGGFRFPRILRIRNQDSVEYLFRMMHQEYQRGGQYWRLHAKGSFLELLNLLLSEAGAQPEPSKDKAYVVCQIKAYVEKNYYKKFSVEEACVDTNLNPDYASKLFKQETGIRLVEYINQLRLGKAKKLLLDTDLSIADVAEMAGFSNENYFCTVAKKLYGKTPGSLRAELLNTIAETQE